MVPNKNILTLDKMSKKDRSKTVEKVSETLLLLQTNEKSEEIKILKQIGLDSKIREAERAQTDVQRFTVLEQKFNRNVYSAEQIKRYCATNGYKIIRVDKFQHEVPVIVGEKILEFVKENTYTVEKNEDRSVEKSAINLQASHFFLLTSIQSINGANVKAATLFYRETYHHDNYHRISEEDMLIEVASWGIPGSDKNLFWYYVRATDFFLLFPVIFFLIGVLCVIFGSSMHSILIFLISISIVAVTLIDKKSFFKWNSN